MSEIDKRKIGMAITFLIAFALMMSLLYYMLHIMRAIHEAPPSQRFEINPFRETIYSVDSGKALGIYPSSDELRIALFVEGDNGISGDAMLILIKNTGMEWVEEFSIDVFGRGGGWIKDGRFIYVGADGIEAVDIANGTSELVHETEGILTIISVAPNGSKAAFTEETETISENLFLIDYHGKICLEANIKPELLVWRSDSMSAVLFVENEEDDGCDIEILDFDTGKRNKLLKTEDEVYSAGWFSPSFLWYLTDEIEEDDDLRLAVQRVDIGKKSMRKLFVSSGIDLRASDSFWISKSGKSLAMSIGRDLYILNIEEKQVLRASGLGGASCYAWGDASMALYYEKDGFLIKSVPVSAAKETFED